MTAMRFMAELFHNARNLLADACILYNAKSYPTAFALAVLCYEELGKIDTLDGIVGDYIEPTSARHAAYEHIFLKAGRNHRVKQIHALFNTAKRGQWSKRYMDGYLDELKQSAFYVDFRNGRIRTPERISRRMAYHQVKRVIRYFASYDNPGWREMFMEGCGKMTRPYFTSIQSLMAKIEPPTRRSVAEQRKLKGKRPTRG